MLGAIQRDFGAPMDKSLIIVIDQFSDRVLDNSNVTLFDYGKLEKVAYIDNYYNVYNGSFSGYGNYDDLLLVEDYGYGFFPVSKDGVLYSYTSDLDFIARQSFIDIFGLTAYADNYLSLSRTNQSSELSVNHGDWVVEALLQTLDRPQYTEIICIDVDTLNGEYSHFDDVFDQTLIYFDGSTFIGSNLEKILTSFLSSNDTRFSISGSTQYALGGISLSIGGTLPDINEAIFLDFLETARVPIFQAAPNVNQGFYDYAMVFPNVITVGAWNKSNANGLLLGSDSTIATIDIVADGLVSKNGWGWNFGTSFATPKVAAEFLNILNDAIVSLNNSGKSLSDIETPDIEGIIYSNFVNSIIHAISTDVLATINGEQISGIKVLTSTVEQNGFIPKTVSGVSGSSFVISSASADVPQVNRPPNGSVTITGNAIQGQVLTASNTLSDADGLGVITYTWRAGGTPVGTGTTYTLSHAEVGKTITVTASYIDGGNTMESVSSAATATVANIEDAPVIVAGDGIVTTKIGSEQNIAQGVLLQPDQKILIVGYSNNGKYHEFALIRYNIDGSLDTSFDFDGKVTTAIGSSRAEASSALLQPDGKILLAGGSDQEFTLARYNDNGDLDSTFGNSGIVTMSVTAGADIGHSVALQPDGKILFAGYSLNGNTSDYSLVRLNSNGSLDSLFGQGGKVITPIGTGDDFGLSTTLQSDGKILVAGYSHNGSNNDFSLARYNTNGSLDTSFDFDGKVTIAIGSSRDEARGITVQSDGKILMAGFSYTQISGNFDFAIVRLNPNGSLDQTFGDKGKVITSIGIGDDISRSITLQPDGKILVLGYCSNSESNDFALARYNTDGSLDTTFDSDGIVTTSIGIGNDFGLSVTVQSNGKILAAGYSEDKFALVRYNSDGSLDKGFDSIGGTGLNVSVRTWNTNSSMPSVGVTIGQNTLATDPLGLANFVSAVDSSTLVSAAVASSSSVYSGASQSVTLQDAVSILKMIGGQSADATPVSRFQSLAADFDGSGTVSLADALGVLRHAVGLPAPTPSWVFVEEGDDALSSVLSPGVPVPVTVDVTPPGPIEVNLIGVLRGDVDGSYGVYGS